jgi:hypothetical protein
MKTFLAVALFFISLTSVAQDITGPTTVAFGQSATYTYTDDVIYSTYTWEINNGTKTSQSRVGINYNVTITWNVSGPGLISFKDNNGVTLATLGVSVGACTGPATPGGVYFYFY